MELQTDTIGMLDLLTAPAFCVKDHCITKINAAAGELFFETGMDIRDLVRTGDAELEEFTQGCLYLTLECAGSRWNASVTRQQEQLIFLLDHAVTKPELQALALAARELRSPLSTTMLITDQLMHQQDSQKSQEYARLNRGLYQLLRIIDNMSDAESWYTAKHLEVRNICSVMEEILSIARQKVEATGIVLTYSVPKQPVYTLCSREQLERAVLNMISNSIKFSPAGSTVEVNLTQQGEMLRLSVQDSGSSIGDELLPHVFSRYTRQPSIEDSRHGIGLGMVLIRNTATNHGGTVLIDRPGKVGTRVTMTLAIRSTDTLCTPISIPLPGGFDSGLIHLAEVLPPQMYGNK